MRVDLSRFHSHGRGGVYVRRTTVLAHPDSVLLARLLTHNEPQTTDFLVRRPYIFKALRNPVAMSIDAHNGCIALDNAS